MSERVKELACGYTDLNNMKQMRPGYTTSRRRSARHSRRSASDARRRGPPTGAVGQVQMDHRGPWRGRLGGLLHLPPLYLRSVYHRDHQQGQIGPVQTDHRGPWRERLGGLLHLPLL